MGDGTSFEIDLPVVGTPGIEAGASAVDRLNIQLTAAEKASGDASAAMRAGEIAFKQAETAADRAAKAVEKIGVAADAQRGKLAEALVTGDEAGAEKAAANLAKLEKRQVTLAQKATEAKAALEKQAGAFDSLKTKASAAEEATKKLTIDLEKQKSSAGSSNINFRKLASGMGALGPVGDAAGRSVVQLAGGMSKLGDVFSGLTPQLKVMLGLGALTLIFAAVTAGVIYATIKIAEWAIGLADARATSENLAAGMTKSAAGGKALNAQLESLTTTLPLTREELNTTAKKLTDAGLRGNDLKVALDDAATAAATLKFGPEFEKQMLSLDQQSKVFHAHISQVFGGLKVEGALGGLQKIGKLFDENTESGKAIKVVFESLFQPVVDAMEHAAPKIERFFLKLEIWSLQAMILMKEHQEITKAALAATAGVIKGVVLVARYLLVPALWGVATAVLAATWPFLAVVAALGLVGVAVDELRAHWEGMTAWFAALDFAQIGINIVTGLGEGIRKAGGAVFDALKGVVMGAVDGVKNLLGIHSPSTVFDEEIGQQMGEGAAQGIERTTPRVKGSLEDMLSPPDSGASASSQGGASSFAHGAASLENVTFNFYGVEGAEQAVARFRGMLTAVLEGDAAQLGAMAPV